MGIKATMAMPLGGLKLSAPADKLEGAYAPRMENCRLRDGRIIAAPGRASIATGYGSPITWIGMYSRVEDTTWNMAIGQAGVARWGNLKPSEPRAWSKIAGPALTSATRFDVASGEDRFFFTSLKDGLFQWNGDPATGYALVPGAPKAKFVEYFNDRVVAAHCDIGGKVYSNRIKYSVNGNYADWTGNGSGFLEVWEPQAQAITGLKVLGGRCAIYRENSITDLIPTGTLTPVFQTETRVIGIGTKAPWTIAAAGLMHFFLGSDRIVRAWSGTEMEPIGEKILSDVNRLYDRTQTDVYFGMVSYFRQEYWLVFLDGTVFIFDYVHGTWTRDKFETLTALGEVLDLDPGATWQDTTEQFNYSFRVWYQAGVRSARMFGGRFDGVTLAVDESLMTDYQEGALVPLDSWVETGDIYFAPGAGTKPDPTETGTIKRVMLYYDFFNDSPIEVGISFDRGRTWVTANHIPVDVGVGYVDFNNTGRHVRFRFRSSEDNGRPAWRDFTYEYVPAGPFNP